MENRDAEVAIGVDVGVDDILCEKSEGGRGIWIVARESHLGLHGASVRPPFSLQRMMLKKTHLQVRSMPDTVGVDDPKSELPAKQVGFVGLVGACQQLSVPW